MFMLEVQGHPATLVVQRDACGARTELAMPHTSQVKCQSDISTLGNLRPWILLICTAPFLPNPMHFAAEAQLILAELTFSGQPKCCLPPLISADISLTPLHNVAAVPSVLCSFGIVQWHIVAVLPG